MLIGPSPHSDGSTFKIKGLGDKSKLKAPDSIVSSSSSSSFFPCVCANRGSDLCFRVLGAREARSAKRAEEQQTRATGEGAPLPPRACLRSPENAKK